VFGNLGGVIPLLGQTGVYKPHQWSEWLAAISANPYAHIISSFLFILGTMSGVVLASKLWNRHAMGALALGVGSLWNAFFIPIPLILAELSLNGISITEQGDSTFTAALLLMSIFADAMYNALLAISMVLFSKTLLVTNRKLAVAGFIIAIPTFLVSGQFHFTQSAQLLAIAGPGWLTWWAIFGWTTFEQTREVAQ
jgi:hypothetical protein